MARRRPQTMRGARPNLGVQLAYRRKLYAMIQRMQESVEYWTKAAYRANQPLIAQDETPPLPPSIEFKPTADGRWTPFVDGDPLRNKKGQPRAFQTIAAARRAALIEIGQYLPAEELQAAMNDLAVRWQQRFDTLAPEVAEAFAKANGVAADRAVMKALKDSGFAIDFQMTPAMRDVAAATVQANVGLIRSIPQKYLTEVQGEVMRSVQAGRDLAPLVDFLVRQRGVTKRRAAFIALDQNNKATAAFSKARYQEIGVTEAVWKHSHAGREPRPTHLANDGKRYDVAKGWYDPDPKVRRYIMPGELPNCRCISVPVIPGF